LAHPCAGGLDQKKPQVTLGFEPLSGPAIKEEEP
jgi:hypothetical protein